MSHKLIRELEKRIAMQAFEDAVAAGYVMTVYDEDEGEEGDYITTAAQAWEEADQYDEARIYFYRKPEGEEVGPWVQVGWMFLVFGNDGYDVISDYSANQATEDLLKKANDLADQYA